MLEVAKVAKSQQGETGALSSHVNLLLLWTLADLANDKTSQCWHSQPSLSRASRLSERAVRYALQALKADGHITLDERPGRSTLYTVHPGKTCHPSAPPPRQEVPPPRQEVPPRPQKQTPAPHADEPLNHNKITGARLGVPEGPRAPGDELATAEQMAELRRKLSQIGAIK